MKTRSNFLWPVAIFFVVNMSFGCEQHKQSDLVLHSPTLETTELYENLHKWSGNHTLFGHQNTLAYGYSWNDERNRSDIRDVTGSYPAIYGWDVASFISDHIEADSINKQVILNKYMRYANEGLERGGILTYSWHMENPVTGLNFYDTTQAVIAILPNGDRHDWYKKKLNSLGSFLDELSPEPVIFRPFHEHNGDWFWWGKSSTTEQEYQELWRFTVHYLRDSLGVSNVLWAFSPDRSRMNIDSIQQDYLYAYPGDEYVDILGFDNYWDVGHPVNKLSELRQQEQFIESLTEVSKLAHSKKKPFALTETGLEAIPDPKFWTVKLLAAIEANKWTQKLVYVQVWRNATYEPGKPDHYYAPFPGQISADDFVQFYNHERIIFESQLSSIR